MTNGVNYRCYILPIIAAIVYIIISLPIIVNIFNDWIPYYYYNIFIKALIILVVLFLSCRILDTIYADQCHT
jgi:hypothetical protein